MAQDVYLDNIPLEQALNGYWELLREKGLLTPLEAEEIVVEESLGRITQRGVFTLRSLPHYHSAAMDGIALHSKSTFGAAQTTPIRLKVGEKAELIDTGNPIPQGFDAVVRIEDVEFPMEGYVEITKAAAPWQYIRTIGEDMVVGELLLPSNHKIRPIDVGAMLAGGISKVLVRRRPKVAVIPTGSDLVSAHGHLQPGQIPEFNSHILGLTLQTWGADWIKTDIVIDHRQEIASTLQKATQQADVVIINAGSSTGSRDFTAEVIKELGQVVYHGVGIRPGKPVILGLIGQTPVIGLPGYPVSAHLTLELFVQPLIDYIQGQPPRQPQLIKAYLARRIVSHLGADEFVRVRLGQVKGKTIALPVARGAGTVSSLVKADGLLQIPRLSQGMEAGDLADVQLLRSRQEVEGTILVAGSHDLTLDILADLLAQRYRQSRLVSAHVGSTSGLLALRREHAHVVGTHLLDEATGKYNLPYLSRLLPGREIALVNLAHRQQGLMVMPNNPRNIQELKDLTRDDVVFVNRQRGAGTRILLDLKLAQLGIKPEEITGYDREEFTHMGVAAAVVSGVAHVGLGIYGAASAMGLGFIPLAQERYDLAVEREFLESPQMGMIMEIIKSASFHQMVTRLGGYDLQECGQLVGKTY